MHLAPRPGAAELLRYARASAWPERRETLADRIESAFRRFVLAGDVRFVVRALDRAGVSGPVLDLSPDGAEFRRALAESGIDAAGEAARGSCAAVTMLHVLEHVPDPAASLEAARELLRAAGRLIVQCQNAASWQFLLLGEKWSGLDVPRHLIHFRERDLEALLEYCGFEVLRRNHFSRRSAADLATSVAPWLDPAVRRARGAAESEFIKLLKHLLYIALAAAAVPFTLAGAACRAGARITIEARPKW